MKEMPAEGKAAVLYYYSTVESMVCNLNMGEVNVAIMANNRATLGGFNSS